MSALPTFEVSPHPLEIPVALLALAPDTAVTALRHWFDFAIEETTNVNLPLFDVPLSQRIMRLS